MSSTRSIWTRVPAVFVAAAVVRTLMVVSFPLSFWIADGKNYMDMLVRGVSNLIHSPGYPFIMGLPWRNPLGRWLIDDFPAVFHFVLNATQHAVCIAAAYLGFRLVGQLFGSTAANLFAVLYLLDYRSMLVTSTVTPEWLQASLVIVLYVVTYRAYDAAGLRMKAWLYSLAGVIFFAAYIVKFNSLFLLTLPGLVAIADLRRSVRVAGALAAGALAFLTCLAGFLLLYHRPSTGTLAISHDHAWVLLEKARMFVPDRVLRPETGINTKRLLVLNSVLPPIEHRGPIGHVDFVPEKVRAPYRERYLHLFRAGDAELDTNLEEIELPRPFDFDKAFLPSAYFLDLRESDRLGVAVFREQVAAYPRAYLADVVRRSLSQLVDPNTGLHPAFPASFPDEEATRLGWGFVRLEIPVSEMRQRCYWYDHPVVWVPGAWFFFVLAAVQDYPAPWVILLIGFGCWRAIGDWRRSGRMAPCVFGQLGLALTCVLFLIASNALYHFRWKELHAILPLLAVLSSVSLVQLASLIRGSDADRASSADGPDRGRRG